jgi:hypothetical protein
MLIHLGCRLQGWIICKLTIARKKAVFNLLREILPESRLGIVQAKRIASMGSEWFEMVAWSSSLTQVSRRV